VQREPSGRSARSRVCAITGPPVGCIRSGARRPRSVEAGERPPAPLPLNCHGPGPRPASGSSRPYVARDHRSRTSSAPAKGGGSGRVSRLACSGDPRRWARSRLLARRGRGRKHARNSFAAAGIQFHGGAPRGRGHLSSRFGRGSEARARYLLGLEPRGPPSERRLEPAFSMPSLLLSSRDAARAPESGAPRWQEARR